MFRSTALSILLHLGCAGVLYGVYCVLPTRPVVLYVEPVWEGSGFARPERKPPGVGSEILGDLAIGRHEKSPIGDATPTDSSAARALRVEDFLVGNGNQGPEYPPEASTRGWEGEVEIGIRFVEGNAEVALLQSSGYAVLDEEAVRTAKTWRPPPTMRENSEEPIRVRIEFTLRPASEAGEG
ncbi:MAG: energy transducer TonB [Bdellovibrionales bacterium]|nr:energy transducer TonB [Bdellovibrionales bacterium]